MITQHSLPLPFYTTPASAEWEADLTLCPCVHACMLESTRLYGNCVGVSCTGQHANPDGEEEAGGGISRVAQLRHQ